MENLKWLTKTELSETEILFEVERYYNDGDTYTANEKVYTTEEAARDAAEGRCRRHSNLLFLGVEEKMIGGVVYFEPTFNVWD